MSSNPGNPSNSVTRTRDPHIQNRNGIFYYRRRVPLSLVKTVGREFIHFSLGVSDRKEALKLRSIHDVRWDAEFESLGRNVATPTDIVPGAHRQLSNAEVIKAVRDYVREMDAKRGTAYLLDPPSSEAERTEMQADADYELSILGNLDDPRSHEYVYAASKPLFGSPEALTSGIGELVRQALIEIASRRFARVAGDNSRTHFSKLFDPEQSQETTFGEVSKQYLEWTEKYGDRSICPHAR